MAVNLDAMMAEVQKTKGLGPSVKTFIDQLKATLAAELADDPVAQAKVDAALQDLIAHNAEIAAAIQANP